MWYRFVFLKSIVRTYNIILHDNDCCASKETAEIKVTETTSTNKHDVMPIDGEDVNVFNIN